MAQSRGAWILSEKGMVSTRKACVSECVWGVGGVGVYSYREVSSTVKPVRLRCQNGL